MIDWDALEQLPFDEQWTTLERIVNTPGDKTIYTREFVMWTVRHYVDMVERDMRMGYFDKHG